MLTRRRWLLAVVLALSSLSAAATTTIDRADGVRFVFGDWSTPAVFMAKTAGGETQLLRRTCKVLQQHPVWPTTQALELISFPVGKEVWLGEPAQHYLVVQSKIWGVSLEGVALRIKQSETVGDAPDAEERLLEAFLQRFVKEPRTRHWADDGTVTWLDLRRIFTVEPLRPMTAMVVRDQATISAVTVDGPGVTFVFATKPGYILLLSLGPQCEILAAQQDGRSIPVLFDGRDARKEPHGFGGLGHCSVVTESGSVEALISHQDYVTRDASGEERPLAQANAVVLPTTGDLWIGPNCWIATVEDRIFGVRAEKPVELLLFTGPQARIPFFPPEGIRVFRKQLQQFEEAFKANQYQWQPALRLHLPELLKAEATFPEGSSFWLSGLSVKDKRLVIVLTSSTSRVVEVVVGLDLKVVSAKLLPPDSRPHG